MSTETLYNLFFIIINLLFMMFLGAGSLYVLSLSILNYKIEIKKFISFVFLSVIPFIFLNGITVLWPFEGDTVLSDFLWESVFILSNYLLLGFLLSKTYQDSLTKIFSTAGISSYFYYLIYHLYNLTLFSNAPKDADLYLEFALLFLAYMLLFVSVFLLRAVLKKIHFSRYYSFFFSNQKASITTLVFSLAMMEFPIVLRVLMKDWENAFSIQIVFLSAIFLGIIAIQAVSVIWANRERIRIQQEIIVQQKAHVQILENFHAELKTFRHDFKNILSGMALQANEGNVEEIQTFLNRTLGYLDEKLSHQVQQMSHLSRVTSYPLRSLLTVKLGEIKLQEIEAILNIPTTLGHIKMKEEDLIRCIGILVDNAIEEATKHQKSKVVILLLNEDSELRIAVSNTCPEKPNLQVLSRSGFSTKGKGRGLGLSSYHRILSNYSNCRTRMIWQDEMLIQELRISSATTF